jgi:hypothetical protein
MSLQGGPISSDAGPERRETLERQLEIVSAARVGEDGTCRTIFSIFAAAEAVLIDAFFSSDPGRSMMIVCVIGIASSVAFWCLLHRALGHLAIHEELILKLENALKVPPEFSISRDRNPRLYGKLTGFRARSVMRVSAALVSGAWLLLFLWTVVNS